MHLTSTLQIPVFIGRTGLCESLPAQMLWPPTLLLILNSSSGGYFTSQSCLESSLMITLPLAYE
jgi:hypothetical protein